MPITSEEWEAKIPMFRELWAKSYSTAEIGRRLGMTKNAIVGKAHRLGFPSRPNPIIRDPDRVISDEERKRRQRAQQKAWRDRQHTLPPLKSAAEAISPPPDHPSEPTPKPIVVIIPPKERDHRVAMMVGRANLTARRGPTLEPIATTPPPEPERPRPFAVIRECAWPIGEPGAPGFRMCDAPADGKRSYCEAHCHQAYVGVRDRREVAP
jgi:GcrA cell cycle regulator